MCSETLLPFIITAKQDDGFVFYHMKPFDSRVLLKLFPWTRDLTLTSYLQALHKWQFAVADNRWHQIPSQAVTTSSVWYGMCPSVPKEDWRTQRVAPCEVGCQWIVLEGEREREIGGRGFMFGGHSSWLCFFFFSHHHTFIFVPALFPLLLLFLMLFTHIFIFISCLCCFNFCCRWPNCVLYSFDYLILN